MDPARLSDLFPGRFSLTQDETIEVERGHHQMTFDDSLRSSIGHMGDPMFVSTERKAKKDAEESLTSSQMSVASGQSTSSLGILQLDTMADLSASIFPFDSSLNQPSFSHDFGNDRDFHVNGQASDFKPGERGKATGVESMESSEIDTEDELDAVRTENAKRALYPGSSAEVHTHHPGDGGESSDSDDHAQHCRPRLEGGSSDEQDSTLPSSPPHEMSLRQSAEGEVMTSPVLGDGGGGGDGMSDGETTRSSLTAPSVISGGNRRTLFRSRSSQSGYSDQERNVEGSVFSDSQQTPIPEVSRLSPHFLLPTRADSTTPAPDPTSNSPDLRPFSSASSFHFEDGVFGSSSQQEGAHQRFWESGMLEREEDRRGNGMEDENADGDKTLINASGDKWRMSLEEFENNEAEINTEQDILEIHQMMNKFDQVGAASHDPRELYNPFESIDNGQERGPLPAGFAAFDGDFTGQGNAEALLDEDQREFEQEHKFRQDEQISSDQFSEHNVSDWTTASKSRITLERSEVTDDDFDRHVSLGEFMRTRTEALGSLSGDGGLKRPSFGIGHIKTPEAKQPIALVETSRLSQVSEEQEGSTDRMQGILGMEDLGESIRFSGVGSDTEDKHGRSSVQSNSASQRMSRLSKDSTSSLPDFDETTTSRDSAPMASMYFRAANPEGSATSSRQLGPIGLFREVTDESKMTSLDLDDLSLADETNSDLCDKSCNSRDASEVGRTSVGETMDLNGCGPSESPMMPNTSDQTMPLTTLIPRQVLQLREESEPDGTRTPPIGTSSIAAAIVNASSCTKPEEFAAMIVALSNKNRKTQSNQAPKNIATESVHKPNQFSPYPICASANEEQKFKDQRHNQSAKAKNQGPQSVPFGQIEREASQMNNGVSGVKLASGTLAVRTQPSGTDSDASLGLKKHPGSSGAVLDSKPQQDEMSFKSSTRKSKTSKTSQQASQSDALSTFPKEYPSVSIKVASSSISGRPSKQIISGLKTTENELLESSTLKELASLELSYNSRMKVHTKRIESIQRAQELLDGGRSGVRDSMDTVDDDSFLLGQSSRRTSPRDVKKTEVDQENAKELARRSSDEEMLEETLENLDETLGSTITTDKGHPSELPCIRDFSNGQRKQKDKQDLGKIKSLDRSQVAPGGTKCEHKVYKNIAKDAFSSDDENDDLPLRHRSSNDPLSNGQPRLKNWKHKSGKFSKTQRTDSAHNLECKRNEQNSLKKIPSEGRTDTFKGKVNFSNRNQGDLDSHYTMKDDRNSLSPGVTPTMSKSSSSLRSTNSSLSESATQTSDDDSALKVSGPFTTQTSHPLVTTSQTLPSGPYGSTPPTLLTSQSLLTNALLKQYLNEQAVTSKPQNIPAVVSSCTSTHTNLDPAQMHPSRASTTLSVSIPSHPVPPLTHLGLTQTLAPLSVNTGHVMPSMNPLQSLDPSNPLLSATRDLGPLLDRVPIPGQASHPVDAQLYSTSATMPLLSLQSAHSLPASVHGLGSLSASNPAALPAFPGASVVPYPVSSFTSRSATSPDYGPPHPIRVTMQGVNPVVVGSINIKGVCCLGIAKQTQLPLRNPGPRWLQCHLEVVSVSLNGEELPPGSLSSFLVKPRTTISPQSTEEVKVVFVPHQPGIYVAQIQVSSSPVVAGSEVAYLSQGVPVTVLARAEKPSIEIRGAQNGTLDLGVLSYEKVRSAPLYLVNKGYSSVPLRLLTRVNSAAWHTFYLLTGDSKTNSDSPDGLNLPTHITLDGPDDTSTLWVHIRASKQEKALSPRSLGAPEQVSAKLEVWLDVPEGGVPITSVTLRATVGLAKLNIPRAFAKEVTLTSTRGEHTGFKVPLKNIGNIPLDLELKTASTQKVFSVIPQATLLAPKQEVDVMIKYAPQKVPSTASGHLQMTVRPDGPFYEVQLHGEAVDKPQDSSVAVFLVNRRYISWGGVPVGRALKQQIVIRSCSKTEDVRLKLSIKDENRAFQLLNTFKTGEWSTDDNQYVTLKPKEDLPVHILFSPSIVGTYQAKLSMKPPGNSQYRYSVPLSGYGGVSKLIADEVTEVEHGCYHIDVGEVGKKQSAVCTVTISNVGRRSAFVKALGFQDEQGKSKLLSTELQVGPSEFILPEGSCRTLTMTLLTDKLEKTWAKRTSRGGFLGGVGLFYGDEILRKQYRRALLHRDSEAVSLSEDNPLRGISFDWPIPGEAKVQVCDLPYRSGDLNLFYRSISRIMLHLRGQLQPANPTSATKTPVAALSPVRTAGNAPEGESRTEVASLSNRPVTVPFTPPVKGTPSPRTQLHVQQVPIPINTTQQPPKPPDIQVVAPVVPSYTSTESKLSWSVLPQRLVLTVPGTGGGVQNRHSIRISNHSSRQLRFETMHTPDCLIVTPAAGVVEPSRQLLVLVSCNPSIQARGVQLPWSGAILVVCDGQQQEVKVQIRDDFGMDTSVIPSLDQMQSLPDQPSTPDTPAVAPSTDARSPVRLQTKVVRFPRTKVGRTSEATLEFENKTLVSRQWYLSSFAPTYVKQDSGEVFRATYSAFRFAHQSGNLEPGQNILVQLEFIPRDTGAYSQYWDLESTDKSVLTSATHKSRIELIGQGIVEDERSPPRRPTKKPRGTADNTLVRVEPRRNPKLGKAALLSSVDNTSEGDVSPEDATVQDQRINTVPDSTTSGGISLVSDRLVFDRTEVGLVSLLKVEVQNKYKQTHTVRFLSPQPPFYIRHHEHSVRPKRYIRLPVTFRPTVPGKHQGVLVIQTEGQHSLMARLEGLAVKST